MWRNSASFSSKLLNSSNPNSKLTFLSSAISTANYGLQTRISHSPSSTKDMKVGFPKLDRVRSSGFASSADAIYASSLAAPSPAWRGRDVVYLSRHYGRCYWELSKARLSMLVVATSGAGYVLGSGSAIDYVGLCYTCAGTMMVAASANSLNQPLVLEARITMIQNGELHRYNTTQTLGLYLVFEINNDAKMKRTMNRPLPSARITVPHALIWASSVGAAGTALLACQANMLAAGLAASNLFLYAFVYTPLKQIHPVNTWVGAIVGAIPPLLGWVAASGQVSLNGMVLPAALYFWQIPHFMALAYLCRNDYAAGGFRMFSLADASGARTALVGLRNCMYLIPLGYLSYDWGITSGWFCLESTILALAISGTALSFFLNRTTKNARRMFHASLLYLPVFMSGLLFHRIPDNQQLVGEEKSERTDENLSSSETLAQEIGMNGQKKVKYAGFGAQAKPLVAFASVAPFPFLPAPIYPT